MSTGGSRRPRASHLTKRVGKYYVGRTIGEGTYAKVKFAQHMDTGEAVAIKVLDKEHLIRTGMVEQVKREISILKRIHHRHVVDLKEVMSSKDKIFMVMELVTGGDLFDKIAVEGPMKEAAARGVFTQLLSALGHCHAHGVYHRDLKPENVLLSSEGDVKLSDFGLGAVREEDTKTSASGILNTICGTPNYAAPEVLAKQGYNGAAADVWSLGVVLYVIMAGCLPFDEDGLLALFAKIAAADYHSPPWLSAEAQSIIASMLTPDPSQRTPLLKLWGHPWMSGISRPSAAAPLPEEAAAALAAVDQEEEELESRRSAGRLGGEDELPDLFGALVNKEHLTPQVALALSGKSGSVRSDPHRQLNAFELINAYLDISAIFEPCEDVTTRRTRFTSTAGPQKLLGAIEAAAVAVGGRMEKRTSYSVHVYIPNRKGPIRVAARILEIVSGQRMVDLSKVSGNTSEFYKWYADLAVALESLATSDRQLMSGPRDSTRLRTKQRMNAFELIGSNFNLSGMFEVDEDNTAGHVQFSSRCSTSQIAKALKEGIAALGGSYEGSTTSLQLTLPAGAGRKLLLRLRMLELLPGIQVVQLVKDRGSMLDLYKAYNKLAAGPLGEVIMRRSDGRSAHPRAQAAASLASSSDLDSRLGGSSVRSLLARTTPASCGSSSASSSATEPAAAAGSLAGYDLPAVREEASPLVGGLAQTVQ